MNISRRVFAKMFAAMASSAAAMIVAQTTDAALELHRATPAIVSSLDPAPALIPAALYTTMYSGRGTLPTLDMSIRGSGYTAKVVAKPSAYDMIAIPAGASFEITNVCGNGDTQNVVQATTTFYLGANGVYNQVKSSLQTAAQQAPFVGAAGNRVMIQAPTQGADSFADLVIFTEPARGEPDVHVLRLHFIGTNPSPIVYVNPAPTALGGLGAGNDSTTTSTNKATPFASVLRAAAYAAAQGIRQVKVLGNHGQNPITLQTAARTLTYSSVCMEDRSWTEVAAANYMPVEVSELNGGQLVLSRSFPECTDLNSSNAWHWPCSRIIDIGCTWLLSNNNETVIGSIGTAANRYGGPIFNVNTINIGINRTRVDTTADLGTTGLYTEIINQFTDAFFLGGGDTPEISYIGEFNGTGEARVSNFGNLQINSTFNQVGCDMWSTTDTNMGETLHAKVYADESRNFGDRLHISRGVPIASVNRDPLNELTTFVFAQEQFAGVAMVSISGNTATIQTYVDNGTSTPTKLMPHRFNAAGATVSIGVFNIFFPAGGPGPLAGVKPAGKLGFDCGTTRKYETFQNSTYASTFTVDVTGLGLANTNGFVFAGSFTFASAQNYPNTGPYSSPLVFTKCASNPSTVAAITQTDIINTAVYTGCYNGSGSNPIPAAGALPWICMSSGPGSPYAPATDRYGNPQVPAGLYTTPRVTIAGNKLTGKGFANGGLNASGTQAASPAVATQDAPAPTTTLTTTTTNGRTLVQCSGALPPSTLFYRGCTVYVGGQKLKVAPTIGANSFYATPIGSFTDVTTPTSWSFSDNQHGIFPGAQIVFNATFSTSGSYGLTGGTVANVLSVAGEVVTVDADLSALNTTTPRTFLQFASATTSQAVCIENYYDDYGVAITPKSSGMAAGDAVAVLILEHPDDFQNQNAGKFPHAKPWIRGIIRDRVHTRGVKQQFYIADAYNVPGSGTVSIDANGIPTFNLPNMTVAAIDSATPKPYQCYGSSVGGSGNGLPGNGFVANDYVNTPQGATSFSALNFYLVTFNGADSNFQDFGPGWGNIRIKFNSGALAGKSLRLYAQTTRNGQMTAFLQDDLGVTAGNLALAVGDTAPQPLPLTDGCVVTIGYKGDNNSIGRPDNSSNVAKGYAQNGIVKLDPANIGQAIVHRPFLRFAGQSNLPWTVTPCISNALFRCYQFTEYGDPQPHGVTAAVARSFAGTTMALADFTYMNSTILSYPSGSLAWVFQWQAGARMNFIDSVLSGPLAYYQVSGAEGFDDVYFTNCCLNQVAYGPNSPTGTPSAISATPNAAGNILGWCVEVDPMTSKPVAVYPTGGGTAQSLGIIPKIPARGSFAPFTLDGTTLSAGMSIGALQP